MPKALPPELRSIVWPVTPIIPPTVASGQLITSGHQNMVRQAISDLWTNLQALNTSTLGDPTTTLGDLMVRGSAALNRLPVGADHQVLTADSTQPLGVRWALVDASIIGAVPSSRQVIAGAGMTGGGPLTSDVTLNALVTSVFGRTGDVILTAADLSGLVADDTTNQRVQTALGGTLIGTRRELNFIAGTDQAINIVDNPAQNRVDITLSTTGSGGTPAPTIVAVNGAVIGTRPEINFISGSNVTVTGIDNGGAGRVDVTFNATGGASLPAGTNSGDILFWDEIAAAWKILPRGYLGELLTVFNDAPGASDPLGWTSVPAQPMPSFYVNGSLIAQRNALNFIAGSGVTLSGVLYQNQRVDVTITATGGGGTGSQTPWTSDINAANFALRSVGRIGIGNDATVLPHVVTANPSLIVGSTTDTSFGATTLCANASSLAAAVGGLFFANYHLAATEKRLAHILCFTDSALDSGAMTFGTFTAGVASERMRITAAGNVGIGTASPSVRLEVSGRSNIVSTAPGTFDVTLGVTNSEPTAAVAAGILRVTASNASANNVLVTGVSSTGTVFEFAADGRVYLAGNVGIGTTNPGATLHVAGSALFRPVSGNLTLTFQDGAPTSTTTLVQTPTLVRFSNNVIPIELSANTNGGVSNQLVLATTGNVGIGSPGPPARLTVYSSADHPYSDGLGLLQLQQYNNANFRLYAGMDGAINKGYIQAMAVGAGPLALLLNPAGGGVGINSNNPAHALHVVGQLGVGSTAFVTQSGDISLARDNAPGTAAIYFGNSGNHYIWWDGSQFTLQGSANIVGNCNISGQYLINGVPITTGGMTAIGVYLNGAGVASRPNLNFLSGSQITAHAQDIAGNNWAGVWFDYTPASDLRIKQKVTDLAGGLSIVNQLRPVGFEFNGLGGYPAGKRGVSVVAQELQQILPDAVSPYRRKLHPEDTEETELLSIDPNTILFHLVLAAKQLDQRLKALEGKVN